MDGVGCVLSGRVRFVCRQLPAPQTARHPLHPRRPGRRLLAPLRTAGGQDFPSPRLCCGRNWQECAGGCIDLILRNDGRSTLVQCKHMECQQVDISFLREMYGLLAHHNADAVKIFCSATYTQEAEPFSHRTSIEIVNIAKLLEPIEISRAVELRPLSGARG
ncbi:restriction endonuclease [Xanthomonas arboricola]|uniref:restriction endonuclease n=1 Tax=Xanthomonas arboricola TaxID=56448 RepID=UPI003CCFD28E